MAKAPFLIAVALMAVVVCGQPPEKAGEDPNTKHSCEDTEWAITFRGKFSGGRFATFVWEVAPNQTTKALNKVRLEICGLRPGMLISSFPHAQMVVLREPGRPEVTAVEWDVHSLGTKWPLTFRLALHGRLCTGEVESVVAGEGWCNSRKVFGPSFCCNRPRSDEDDRDDDDDDDDDDGDHRHPGHEEGHHHDHNHHEGGHPHHEGGHHHQPRADHEEDRDWDDERRDHEGGREHGHHHEGGHHHKGGHHHNHEGGHHRQPRADHEEDRDWDDDHRDWDDDHRDWDDDHRDWDDDHRHWDDDHRHCRPGHHCPHHDD